MMASQNPKTVAGHTRSTEQDPHSNLHSTLGHWSEWLYSGHWGQVGEGHLPKWTRDNSCATREMYSVVDSICRNSADIPWAKAMWRRLGFHSLLEIIVQVPIIQKTCASPKQGFSSPPAKIFLNGAAASPIPTVLNGEPQKTILGPLGEIFGILLRRNNKMT